MKYAKRALALTLIVLPILAAAQLPSNQRIVAQVPFEFMVNNKYVPAGECIVERAGMSISHVLIVRNVAAKVGLFAPAASRDAKHVSTSYALVFRKYGDLRVLAGIRIAGSNATYELPKTKAELEVAKNAVPTEEILLASLR